MSYRHQRAINWGATIALLLAIPSALAWCAFVYIGSALVCADPEAHCGSPLLALIEGLGFIAASATALGWLLNRVLRRAGQPRRP